MPIVIDADIAIDWFLPHPNAIAEKALDSVVSDGAVVPALWRWEVQDVLRRLHLTGRVSASVAAVCAELRELPITVDDHLTRLFGNELDVSTRYNLSPYDAAYLELAMRLRLSLVTDDKALSAAATSSGLRQR